MRRNILWTNILAITWVGILLSQWTTWAAINPEAIRKGHPECVTIQVVASHIEKCSDLTKVYLAAKIVEVFRSDTSLKSGDLILITYQQNHARLKKERAAMEERAKMGWVGPQIFYFPSVLKNGDVRVAHLGIVADDHTTGNVYAPQAHQYSFEPEEAKRKYGK